MKYLILFSLLLSQIDCFNLLPFSVVSRRMMLLSISTVPLSVIKSSITNISNNTNSNKYITSLPYLISYNKDPNVILNETLKALKYKNTKLFEKYSQKKDAYNILLESKFTFLYGNFIDFVIENVELNYNTAIFSVLFLVKEDVLFDSDKVQWVVKKYKNNVLKTVFVLKKSFDDKWYIDNIYYNSVEIKYM